MVGVGVVVVVAVGVAVVVVVGASVAVAVGVAVAVVVVVVRSEIRDKIAAAVQRSSVPLAEREMRDEVAFFTGLTRKRFRKPATQGGRSPADRWLDGWLSRWQAYEDFCTWCQGFRTHREAKDKWLDGWLKRWKPREDDLY